MDVFYYWKDFDEDVKAGRIGWLKSERQKLGEMRNRNPDLIWAFKTPPGCKGLLQLVARLAWSDTPKVVLPKIDAASFIHYDAFDPRTKFFWPPRCGCFHRTSNATAARSISDSF